MALNPTPVGDQIAAFVKSQQPAPGAPVSDNQLKAMWEGIMQLIYDDIKANAQITVQVASVSGVVPGGGVSGPGAGTGTIA
jgi:hypothetical protein